MRTFVAVCKGGRFDRLWRLCIVQWSQLPSTGRAVLASSRSKRLEPSMRWAVLYLSVSFVVPSSHVILGHFNLTSVILASAILLLAIGKTSHVTTAEESGWLRIFHLLGVEFFESGYWKLHTVEFLRTFSRLIRDGGLLTNLGNLA